MYTTEDKADSILNVYYSYITMGWHAKILKNDIGISDGLGNKLRVLGIKFG